MSETSKEKDDEKLTPTKVHETIKSGSFLKELFWDVLSNLKDKNAFKDIREKVEKVMKIKTDALETLTDSEPDRVHRTTIVSELCTLAYVVDTVFSKILFVKLEHELKAETINIIKVLRSEGKIPDDIWEEFEPSLKAIDENTKEAGCSIEPDTGTSGKSTPVKGKQSLCSEKDKKLENLKCVSKCNAENGETLTKKNVEARSQEKAASVPLTSTPKKKLPDEKNELTRMNTRINNSSDKKNEPSEIDSKNKNLSNKKAMPSKRNTRSTNLTDERNVSTKNTRSKILTDEKDVFVKTTKRQSSTDEKDASLTRNTRSKNLPVEEGMSVKTNTRSKYLSNEKELSLKAYTRSKNLTGEKEVSKKANTSIKNSADKMNTPSKKHGKETLPKDKNTSANSNGNDQNINGSVDIAGSLLDDITASDTDSIISVGGLSLASVSSVHTSDLSSFDDNISVSSEDEEGLKKKLPLKELMAQKSNETSIAEESDISKKPSSPKTSDAHATENAAENVGNHLPTSSIVSKRVRKPNSRYSSDAVFCPAVKVKERKKQSTDSTKHENEENSNETSLKRKKAKSETCDAEVGTPNKIQKRDNGKEMENDVSDEEQELPLKTKREIKSEESPSKVQKMDTFEEKESSASNEEMKLLPKEESDMEVETNSNGEKVDTAKENATSVNKNPAPQNGSSELPKPQSSVSHSNINLNRSLTSRRTAPVTLYST